MDLKEIQEELFRQEYPQLLAGSDPDIERYCYLRSSGQGRQALNIYQIYLKPRYPDDVLRMALLHSYRSRDPLYPRLLAVGYHRLAERALERVRKLIDYIGVKIRTCDSQDVYSTIKTIEDILRFFPREQYEAVSGVDRLYRYAQVLDYQVKPMEQAAEMVRSYLSRSLPVLEKERRRRQQEQSRREKQTAPALIDFSAVVFSKEDLERIEIPSDLSRIEDQTLAYCAKYWNLIDDVSFEQILFLYSRKYRTKNHTVYAAIRQGRRANHRDEEILTSVMSLLVTGYYYSIQGDRYLQQNWREIKFNMDRAVQAAKNAAFAAPVVQAKPAPKSAAKSAAPAEPAVPAVPRPTPARPAVPKAKPAAPVEPAVPVAPRPAPPRPAVPKAKPAAPAKLVVPAVSRPAAARPAAPKAKPAVPAEPIAPAVPRPAPARPTAPKAKPAVPAEPIVPAVSRPAPPRPMTPKAKPSVPVEPIVPAVSRSAPPRSMTPKAKPAAPAEPVVPAVPR
ncbi:MAG: hypothetical protein LBU19_03285, partial [Treponema sp.]|nr:hypothetical protein [Treponema sp.]